MCQKGNIDPFPGFHLQLLLELLLIHTSVFGPCGLQEWTPRHLFSTATACFFSYDARHSHSCRTCRRRVSSTSVMSLFWTQPWVLIRDIGGDLPPSATFTVILTLEPQLWFLLRLCCLFRSSETDLWGHFLVVSLSPQGKPPPLLMEPHILSPLPGPPDCRLALELISLWGKQDLLVKMKWWLWFCGNP